MEELSSSRAEPSRTIHHGDALVWLADQKGCPNIITGIPDINEVNLELADYLAFFDRAAGLIFDRLDPNGYGIFLQTDRKINKTWISKSARLITLGERHGFKLCWHKIILNREAGATDLFRPTYSHMLCFSVHGTSGAATPDVIPVSPRSYNNASPLAAVVQAVTFVKRYTKAEKIIIDPFVGQGTIVAVANHYGLNAVGIDINPDQVALARVASAY